MRIVRNAAGHAPLPDKETADHAGTLLGCGTQAATVLACVCVCSAMYPVYPQFCNRRGSAAIHRWRLQVGSSAKKPGSRSRSQDPRIAPRDHIIKVLEQRQAGTLGIFPLLVWFGNHGLQRSWEGRGDACRLCTCTLCVLGPGVLSLWGSKGGRAQNMLLHAAACKPGGGSCELRG